MIETPTVGTLAVDRPTISPVGRDNPGKILESARQFEALLIGQIMRGMRESAGGWLGSGEDQAGASIAEFAEQQMAQVLSAGGGFGLASLIAQGLVQKQPSCEPIFPGGAAGVKLRS